MHPASRRCLSVFRVIATLSIFLPAAVVRAQSSTALGQVRGTVVDATSHVYLVGAEASLGGTDFVTSVGNDGTFLIPEVPPGQYTLNVTYVGYAAASYTVTVTAGRTATVAAELSPRVVKMAAFIVEGPREGQARAINIQKSQVIDSNIVASDAIGNFPDQNAAQALQRVPGISVQQLYGQATTVTIRGAGSDLNTITLDGVNMMGNRTVGSTGQNLLDGRSVSLNDFPAQLLSTVTVVKTPTPDMNANAIGGIIQLKTKSAFDFDHPVEAANAALQFSSESQKFGYLFGLTYVNRFGARKDWGISVSASKSRLKGLEEQIEVKSEGIETLKAGPQNYTGYTMLQPEFGNYDHDDRRSAVSLGIEKKFGDTTHLYLRAARTLWIQKSGRPSLDLIDSTTLDPSQPVSLSGGDFQQYTMTGVTVQRSVNPRTLSTASTNAILGGETNVDGWKLDYAADYNRGYGETEPDGVQFQSTGKATIAYDLSNPFPSFTQVAGPDIYNPANFDLKSAKQNSIIQRTSQYTVKADVQHPIAFSHGRLTFKTGFNLRWSKIQAIKYASKYKPAKGVTIPIIGTGYGYIAETNADFLGHYRLGPSVDPRGIANFVADNPSLFKLDQASSVAGSLGGDYGIDENIFAGYVMGTWTRRPWTLIAGMRYEGTHDRSQGYQIPATASANPADYPLQNFRTNYNDLMPGILLRYSPKKNLIFRASWTNTLARPDGNYIAPTQDINIQTNPSVANPDTVSGGNPTLHATTSMNWDASVDYYLSSIGVLSAGVFYKDIKSPVYQSTFRGTFQGDPAIYTVYANASKGWISGVELDYQQNLTFLPSPFDGLGIYANLTLVNSNVHVPDRPGENFTFFNQTDRVANVALSYQRFRFYARLAYNWTGAYLTTLDSPGLDEYQAPFHTLDFLASYTFARHWSIKVTANNLTNVPTREYFGNPAREDVYAQDGRFFTFGVDWSY